MGEVSAQPPRSPQGSPLWPGVCLCDLAGAELHLSWCARKLGDAAHGRTLDLEFHILDLNRLRPWVACIRSTLGAASICSIDLASRCRWTPQNAFPVSCILTPE